MATTTPADATMLIGRTAQVRRLAKAIEATDLEGSALVLHGEPGIGKSVLLDAAREIAGRLGLRVLHTAGVLSEEHMPLAGLHRLLRPLKADIATLTPRHRSVLASAFSLGELRGEALMQVALATLDLLSAAATERPLVIIADDLQWLDRESREVIAFVARRVVSDPIVVIGAMRDGYKHKVGDLGISTYALHSLSDRDAADLLDACAPGLAPGTRAQVLAEAAGNPLGIVELPNDATLTALTEGVSGPLPVTTRLEDAFGGGGLALPDPTAKLLLLCAADPAATVSEILAAGEHLTGEPMTLSDLEPAIDAALIGITDYGPRFRHSLMRSATYQAVGLQPRHAAHAALVEVVEDPDRAAWHRAASTLGQDDDVAQQMEERAWRADGRGEILQAATSLGRAAELTADQQLRGNRLLSAAQLAFEVGRADLVTTYVDQTSGLTLDAIGRARAENLRTFSFDGVSGERERVRSLVMLAEQANEDGDPDTALGLLLGASWRTWWADPGEAVRDRVIAAAEATPVDPYDARLLATIAVAAPITHGAMVAERLPLAIASIASTREAHLLGTAAHAVTDFAGAQHIFRTVEDEIRSHGQLGLLTYIEIIRGWSSLLLGEWGVSATAAAEGLRLSRETGQPVMRGFALSTLAGLAGIRGDVERAEELAAEAESILLPARISGGLAQLQIARGLTDLSAGRYEEAHAQLARCFDPQDPAHHPSEQFGAVGFFADAAAMTGRQAEARAIFERLRGYVGTSSKFAGFIGGTFEFARPVVAADAEAEGAFIHALQADASPSPFDRARCNLFYGMWLRRRRRVIESRGPLRAAREGFDRLDAPAWGARSRQELRAAGEGDTGNARAQRTWDDLSPQELQIAQMAAAGLSNRDIGSRLYLSHRTVASHLYRIFPKLGITSRSQLNGVLPGRSAATSC